MKKKNTIFKLKALRVEHDLTQEELGHTLGIHEATYNRKELGMNQFTLKEARVISQLFKKTVDEIFFTK